MIGDRAFIAHRMAGKPVRDSVVYIDADGGPVDASGTHFGDHCCVSITRDDYLPTLDMRFVHGLMAKVEGEDPDRVAAIAAAAGQHARRVIAVTFHRGRPEVASITDTDGVMTWPK